MHTITMLQADITRLATIIKNKMLAISPKSSSLSPPPSPVYVSRQTAQGSLEIFTSEDPNAVTPMSIFGEPANKPIEKNHTFIQQESNWIFPIIHKDETLCQDKTNPSE